MMSLPAGIWWTVTGSSSGRSMWASTAGTSTRWVSRACTRDRWTTAGCSEVRPSLNNITNIPLSLPPSLTSLHHSLHNIINIALSLYHSITPSITSLTSLTSSLPNITDTLLLWCLMICSKALLLCPDAVSKALLLCPVCRWGRHGHQRAPDRRAGLHSAAGRRLEPPGEIGRAHV